MTSPDGAWMTRNGDVIEIGCHSGSKTWTLRCVDQSWVGAVGYCGSGPSRENDAATVNANEPKTSMTVSPSKLTRRHQTCTPQNSDISKYDVTKL